ncbi:hypothetical protein [Arachnia propionica]|uniref:Uncharacterized protein n=1 Tax=Arachnia propionica TaxID=1750 RepID=A0A3P1WKV4_9ACTN|nr:hypothetical protein [Arachnia propionica]RRD46686.1 hypothetical protein EII35_15475 [Arachnia propionica]
MPVARMRVGRGVGFVVGWLRVSPRRRGAGVHHLSFEGPRIMPGISAPRPSRPHFVAALDGRALAVASPHGRWVDWL